MKNNEKISIYKLQKDYLKDIDESNINIQIANKSCYREHMQQMIKEKTLNGKISNFINFVNEWMHEILISIVYEDVDDVIGKLNFRNEQEKVIYSFNIYPTGYRKDINKISNLNEIYFVINEIQGGSTNNKREFERSLPKLTEKQLETDYKRLNKISSKIKASDKDILFISENINIRQKEDNLYAYIKDLGVLVISPYMLVFTETNKTSHNIMRLKSKSLTNTVSEFISINLKNEFKQNKYALKELTVLDNYMKKELKLTK